MATTRDYEPDLYPGDASNTWNVEEELTAGRELQRRAAKSGVDEWNSSSAAPESSGRRSRLSC